MFGNIISNLPWFLKLRMIRAIYFSLYLMLQVEKNAVFTLSKTKQQLLQKSWQVYANMLRTIDARKLQIPCKTLMPVNSLSRSHDLDLSCIQYRLPLSLFRSKCTLAFCRQLCSCKSIRYFISMWHGKEFQGSDQSITGDNILILAVSECWQLEHICSYSKFTQ